VIGTVGKPRDVVPPSDQCPTQTGGKSHFPRIQWTYATDGPFDVQLVGGSCTVAYQATDATNRHVVVALASAPTVLVFDLVARRPGSDALTLAGYVAGPCTGAAPQLLGECGPASSDLASFEVVADK